MSNVDCQFLLQNKRCAIGYKLCPYITSLKDRKECEKAVNGE